MLSAAMLNASLLLAQGGAAKTAIGWVIFLLAFLLGMLVVLRPSGRKIPDAPEPAPPKKRV